MQRSPIGILGEGVRVTYSWNMAWISLLSVQRTELHEYIHIAVNTRIPVRVPGATNAGFAFENAKLVKSKLLLQPTSHGDS